MDTVFLENTNNTPGYEEIAKEFDVLYKQIRNETTYTDLRFKYERERLKNVVPDEESYPVVFEYTVNQKKWFLIFMKNSTVERYTGHDTLAIRFNTYHYTENGLMMYSIINRSENRFGIIAYTEDFFSSYYKVNAKENCDLENSLKDFLLQSVSPFDTAIVDFNSKYYILYSSPVGLEIGINLEGNYEMFLFADHRYERIEKYDFLNEIIYERLEAWRKIVA